MIRIGDKIVGIWFLPTITGHQDWMACVRELEPDARYELIYRFRYHDDDKVFESEDRKNWYRAEIDKTRAYVIAATREMARQLEKVSGSGELYELIYDGGDIEKFFLEFQKAPFVFARMVNKKEVSNDPTA